ncbi:MAG TPA: phosphodiester glycosidase family protein [Thioalkalivibrio sp.]|nr:phosphodiester glycosidase family protein [Thioalkalivibrio sp.]
MAMRRWRGSWCAVLGLLLLTLPAVRADGEWRALEAGLELGRFEIPHPADTRPGIVHVLRIDPAHFRFRLLAASATEERKPRTARGWAVHAGLVATINASMFQADFLSSVSLMLAPGHVNNPRVSRDKAVLAFDPRSGELPSVRIIDRECDDFESLRKDYATLVQSIRMVSCKGRNVWGESERRWSTALIATDKAGRVLFVHVRTPYSTHELINALLALPLGIDRAMYTEGGVQAQMFVGSGELKREFVGSFGGSFTATTGGPSVWPVPNVIGIERR